MEPLMHRAGMDERGMYYEVLSTLPGKIDEAACLDESV